MSFERYSAGLANEIKNADFKNESEIINFVRSKLHRLWNVKQSKIRKLEKQNKILKDALDFYADQDNWSAGVSEKWDTIHNDGKGITFNCGCESLCEGCDGECYAIVSGNLARQTLKNVRN